MSNIHYRGGEQTTNETEKTKMFNYFFTSNFSQNINYEKKYNSLSRELNRGNRLKSVEIFLRHMSLNVLYST